MAKKSFKIRGSLAEALDDTVSSAKNNAGELHIEAIPLRKIQLDPNNPRDLALSFEDIYTDFTKKDPFYERKSSEKAALSSMVKSIQDQGVINPVVVYKYGEQYRLITGERRTLASMLAKKEDIPAKVLTSRPDQLKLSLLQWVENIEREDLSLWERIRNLEKILDAYATKNEVKSSEITPTSLSQLLGCSLQQGVNYRHVLNASSELKQFIQSNEIKNIEKAAFIAKSQKDTQAKLIDACLNGATLSELKKLAKEVPHSSHVEVKERQSTKVNFGSTKNPRVAQILIHSVLDSESFKHLRPSIGNVQWDCHKSVASAFKKLIRLLEHA